MYLKARTISRQSSCIGQPARHVIVTLARGDVVDDQTARRTAIIAARDGSEPLLTCCVPLHRAVSIEQNELILHALSVA